jgi:tRNA pseudouridine55 synthase
MVNHEKEYIVEATLGFLTDTLDLEGKVIKEDVPNVTNEDVIKVLNSYKKTYEQTVPIYSAVKVNGKKLYEYARNNETVELPKRMVTIKEMELLTPLKDNKFSFRVVVTKGTYIRSLVNDIAIDLNTVGTMTKLIRTKIDDYKLQDAVEPEEITEDKLIPLMSALRKYNHVVIDPEDELRIAHGNLAKNIYNSDVVVFITKDDRLLAIYKEYPKDKTLLKPWKMFIK